MTQSIVVLKFEDSQRLLKEQADKDRKATVATAVVTGALVGVLCFLACVVIDNKANQQNEE